MTDTSKAWVWSQYKGVVSEEATATLLPLFGNSSAKGPKSNEVRAASAKRTAWGVFLAVAMIIGLAFPKIALLLLIFSGLMILSGFEPKRFDDFFNAVPGGSVVLKISGYVGRIPSITFHHNKTAGCDASAYRVVATIANFTAA